MQIHIGSVPGFRLIARYSHGHPAGFPLSTAADIDTLLDMVRAESARTGLPTLAHIHVDDPETPEFYAGVHGDRGVLTYAAPDSTRVWASVGQPTGRPELVYYFCGTSTDLPGDAEIPADRVREAIAQFMIDPDQPPTVATWRMIRE